MLPLLLHLLLAGLAAVHGADARPPLAPQTPAAGGTLAWVFDGELELIGDMRVDLPYTVDRRRILYLSLDARTTIEQAASDFAFLVQDLDYTVDLGIRTRLGPFDEQPVSLFVGQWGTERVDSDGQPFVRYVGVGAESAGFRALKDGLQWQVAAGAVVEEREVRADAIFKASARLHPRATRSRRDGRASGGFRKHLGLDVETDALIDDGELRADWRIGPNLSIALAGKRRLSLFAHYLDSDNPLGLGTSGVLVGLDFSEGGDGFSPGNLSRPDIGGSIMAGGGEGRLASQFVLRMTSPPFGRHLHGVLEIDANILTADDTGEIYYLYHFGIERHSGARAVYGVYFYHRSNHQLAEPNLVGITFLNVVEIGAETSGWGRPGTGAAARWRDFDGRLRVGYLTNGTFGEDRRWHARGGIRWTPLRGHAWGPFLLAEGEVGEIHRQLYGLGVTNDENLELRLEYRKDDQYFGRDQTAVLLTTRVGF